MPLECFELCGVSSFERIALSAVIKINCWGASEEIRWELTGFPVDWI